MMMILCSNVNLKESILQRFRDFLKIQFVEYVKRKTIADLCKCNSVFLENL